MEGGDNEYSLRGRYVYVVWNRSTVGGCAEFYDGLKRILPDDSDIFGGRERIEGSELSKYSALLRLGKKGHWKDARKYLVVPGDMILQEDIGIVKPVMGTTRRSLDMFLEDNDPGKWTDELFGTKFLRRKEGVVSIATREKMMLMDEIRFLGDRMKESNELLSASFSLVREAQDRTRVMEESFSRFLVNMEECEWMNG